MQQNKRGKGKQQKILPILGFANKRQPIKQIQWLAISNSSYSC